MKARKTWSLWIAVLSLAVLLAGCTSNKSNNNTSAEPSKSGQTQAPSASVEATGKLPDNLNAEGFPIVNEPITLEMMGSKTANQLAWNEMVLFQEMEKLTNIRFKFDTPAAESYKEKLNLRFASNTLPDVLFGATLTAENEIMFGSQGQLVPLEDLIDNFAPNIRKLFEEHPDIKKNITTPDGHIYALPFVDTPGSFGVYPKIWINETWLKSLGLSIPKTVSELADALRAFKEKDPNKNGQADEVPLSFHLVAASGMPDIQSVLMNAFGFTGTMTVDSGKVRFAANEPQYKEYLTFMNTLYKEGLLDREGYSQTLQQKNAKGNNQALGAFASGGAFQVVGNDLDKDYSILPPLVSDVNSTAFSVRGNYLTKGTFAITSSNQHPEATIRWVDYLYSLDGALLAAQGLEGKQFEYIENGQGLKALIPEGQNPANFRGTISPNAGTFIPRIHEPIQKLNQYNLKESNPLNYHIAEETIAKLEPVAKDGFPLIYFTLEEQQQLKVLETDISTYVNEMTAKFIVGAEPLDQWDRYIETLGKMNVEQYVTIYQAAYDRWNQSK